MKILRRIIPLLLCVALALCVAACGEKETPEVDLSDIEGNPVATMTMEDGGVVELVLYPDAAPETVRNFIYLSNSGFYDGLTFHRLSPDFCLQGGDPDGTGAGGPGYSITGEFSLNGLPNPVSHVKYTISMARTSVYDSAGSQFFITLSDSTWLDGQYAGFGRVISGFDVIDRLAELSQTGEKINDPPVIASIRVDTKGVDYPEPEKLS